MPRATATAVARGIATYRPGTRDDFDSETSRVRKMEALRRILECNTQGGLMLDEFITQAVKAVVYYAALVVLMRLAGKRLAGQTTTFDLIVLITLGVVLQTTALQKGTWNAVVFIGTVFVLHRVLALICSRSTPIRHLIRGKPRALIRDGHIIEEALTAEGVSRAELLAGLRKLGYEDPAKIKLATLEETGHISAVEA